jgi:hypothetical protein
LDSHGGDVGDRKPIVAIELLSSGGLQHPHGACAPRDVQRLSVHIATLVTLEPDNLSVRPSHDEGVRTRGRYEW